MTTFELARIQTAARALGVAQTPTSWASLMPASVSSSARPLIEFPRVYSKLAWMAVEQNMVRQLVKRVARLKETGVRCDVEAGMAKLVAARVAWSARTTRCRSTAATATRWNTRSRACCAMPASSTSSRARPRFRRRSSRGDFWGGRNHEFRAERSTRRTPDRRGLGVHRRAARRHDPGAARRRGRPHRPAGRQHRHHALAARAERHQPLLGGPQQGQALGGAWHSIPTRAGSWRRR